MKHLFRDVRPTALTDAGSALLQPLLDKLRQADAVPGLLRTWLPSPLPPAEADEGHALPDAPEGTESAFAWVPVLESGAWSLPTAVNLAAFAALAYGPSEGPASARAALDALRRGGRHPRRFGNVETRMIVRPAAREEALREPYRESHFGVQLFLTSNHRDAVLFVQGTDSLLTVLLDTARTQLNGARGPNPVREKLPALERVLEQASEWLNVDMPSTDFLEHKSSMLDYLLSPANCGAHAGFMVLSGSFLFSPAFRRALDEHEVCRKRLFLAGHSLGGALALLLARELQSRCRRRIHVYTFGCPRVGSPRFVRAIPRRIIHYRVVNGRDPVAWMAGGRHWKDHGRLRFLYGEDAPEVRLTPVRGRDWLIDHFLRSYAAQLQRTWLAAAETAGHAHPGSEAAFIVPD